MIHILFAVQVVVDQVANAPTNNMLPLWRLQITVRSSSNLM